MNHSFENKGQFPAVLFGQFRDCRKQWQELLKRVWKAGSWEQVLGDERHRDVRDDATDIVYEIGRGPIDLQIQTPQWWLSYAGDLRPTKSKSTPVLERDQELVRSGLKYLWYALAHLGKHVTLPYLHASDRYFENQRDMLNAVAEAVKGWLPEIIELSPRLAEGAFLPMWRDPVMSPPWVVALVQSFDMGGYRFNTWPDDYDAWTELWPAHRGDPVKFLEILRIIELHAGRYRLGDAIVKRD